LKEYTMDEPEATAVAASLTKEALTPQLETRRAAVDEARQRQRELEHLEATHGLSLMQTQELVGLELWIASEQAHVERLQTQIARAQIAFDVEAAVQHHDSLIETKQQCYQAIAAAIAGLYDAFAELARVDEAQKEPLRAITSPSGTPFAPIGSDELVQNVLSRMPDALAWNGVVFGQKLTKGDLDQMMDVDSGTRPISERMIRRFLGGDLA
jgi:hypothetical protein